MGLGLVRRVRPVYTTFRRLRRPMAHGFSRSDGRNSKVYLHPGCMTSLAVVHTYLLGLYSICMCNEA